MKRSAQDQRPEDAARPAPVEELVRLVQRECPFSVNRVSDSSGAEADVASIHSRAFQRLLELAEECRRRRCGTGVTLWGEAGIGKSHLLARFARWCEQDDRAIHVLLHNMQASPARLPRYVLKCVISRLARGQSNKLFETPLFRLVEHAVGHALENYRGDDWHANPAVAFGRFADDMIRRGSLAADVDDRDIYRVLLRFYLSAGHDAQRTSDGRLAALALRWLGGDVLDEPEAHDLTLRPGDDPDEPATLADNQAIERTLTVLMELAHLRGQPFVLCYDQVDNLEAEQASALARFTLALLDHAPNLLVVTSGVKDRLLDWRESGVIHASAWDRIAQDELTLTRIQPRAARQMLEVRLGQFLEPYAHAENVEARRREDSLFPLQRDWFARSVGQSDQLRPRDVINAARDRWREIQSALDETPAREWLQSWPHGRATTATATAPAANRPKERGIDEEVEHRLAEQVAGVMADPGRLPPDAGNLSGLVKSLLEQCLHTNHGYAIAGVEQPPPKPNFLPTYQLLVRQGGAGVQLITIGMTFVVTGSTASAVASLRRLAQDPSPPDRVLLVTDQRQRLGYGPRGYEYLQSLRARGPAAFQEIELTPSQYVQLHALHAIVGLARSGDLEVQLPDGRQHAVSEGEVVASHHRLDAYRRHVLLRELVGGVTNEPAAAPLAQVNPQPSPITELEARQFLLARLALDGGATTPHLSEQFLRERNLPEDSLMSVSDTIGKAAVQLQQDGLVRWESPNAPIQMSLDVTPKVARGACPPPSAGLHVGETSQGAPVSIPARVLPTHVAVVGAAGSGKTWLAKVMVEEVIRQGVPVVAIDPQGDLVQFIRPSRGTGFPPVHPYWQTVEPRVYTPGSSHGIRFSLNPLRLARDEDLAHIADPARRLEESQGLLAAVAAGVVDAANAGGEVDSQRTFMLRLLRRLQQSSSDGQLQLKTLIDAVASPEGVGMEDAERFIRNSEREKLARKLNALLHGPAASLFTGGRPLDLNELCRPSQPGRTPLNVIYLNALRSDDQKQFLVASVASEIYRWMVTAPSRRDGLNLLFYLDEARDFIPAGNRNPPAKEPLIRLFTQGRKFGVACLLCTQSPRSVDYNVFGNCSTKIVGRRESVQEADTVARWFSTQGAVPSWLHQRKGAPAGAFVARWPGVPPELEGATIQSRQLHSLHEAAWSPDRVERECRR